MLQAICICGGFIGFHVFVSSFIHSCFLTHEKGGAHRKLAHFGEPIFRIRPRKFPKGPLRSKKVGPKGGPIRVLEGAQRLRASELPCMLVPPAPSSSHTVRTPISVRVCPAASCASRCTSRSVLGFLNARMGTPSSHFSQVAAAPTPAAALPRS